tara:strand:- start:196 stop:528 length:333 start_codon:yes stop_codon:yes gene_type:complete
MKIVEIAENKAFMSELVQIIEVLKEQYAKYYIDDEEIECLQLTVGSNGEESEFGTIKYDYQTGDNSYIGGAYGYRCWGIGYVYEDTDSKAMADQIAEQLSDQIVYDLMEC